jgi:hypothetical protein
MKAEVYWYYNTPVTAFRSSPENVADVRSRWAIQMNMGFAVNSIDDNVNKPLESE